jgi:hypothetical protein
MELEKPPEAPETPAQSVELVPFNVGQAVAAQRKADLKELALLSRDKLDANFDKVIDEIMERGRLSLKFAALCWLADRGFGKVPKVVRIDSDDDSPEGMIRMIAARKHEAMQAKLEAITTEIVSESNTKDEENVREEE